MFNLLASFLPGSTWASTIWITLCHLQHVANSKDKTVPQMKPTELLQSPPHSHSPSPLSLFPPTSTLFEQMFIFVSRPVLQFAQLNQMKSIAS